MISIITGIYNQKPMNKLFYETLVKNTHNKFELIIIDNNSDDGSREYFLSKDNVKLINTGANYNYPYCQNIGIENAKYDILCFFNNDILVTKDWDKIVLNILVKNRKIKAISVSSNDHVENRTKKKKLRKKWKYIKYPIQFLLGNSSFSLKLMIKIMYGNLERYSKKKYKKWGEKIIEGYSGSAIILKKELIDEIGLWDERIQAADFDLFNRIKEKSLQNENIMPLHLALGVYFHHYLRLTLRKKYPPFKNADLMITLEEKWGDKTKILRKDIIG